MKDKLIFWSSFLLIIIVYLSFMTYYCVAKPCDEKNIIIEKGSSIVCVNDINLASSLSSDNMRGVIASENKSCSIKSKTVASSQVDREKTIGPEVYLCEITDFYEFLIGLLATLIFIILGLVFFFAIRTSKIQAEEMARDFLKGPEFRKEVSDKANKFLSELKNEGDIPAMCEELESLNERVNFLENAITKQGYISESQEETNGNNQTT